MSLSPVEVKRVFDRLGGVLARQQRECDAVDSWL